MTGPRDVPRQLYRIWIATYDDWQPSDSLDVPPKATAVAPAEANPLPADQAQAFLEGFNSRMINVSNWLWAVAVPVSIAYDGDARPGVSVVGHRF